jgi:O-antigen/teichoic acid export membrane protein
MINKLKSKGMKQALFTITEQGFSSVLLFVTGILLARATTKEDFGMYVLGLGIIMILIGFQRAIISTPYAILFNQKTDEEKALYRSSNFIFFTIFLILSSIIFIIGLLVINLVELNEYTTFTICLMVLLVGNSILYFFKYTLIAELALKQNLIYCLVIYFLTLLLLLYFFYFDQLTTNKTFIITSISIMVVSIFFYIYYFKYTLEKITLKNTKKYFDENWKLGKWIVGSNFAFMFSSQIFPWLLLYFWGKISVAELGVVLSISRILAPAVQGFWSFLLPKMTTYINEIEKFKVVLKQLIIIMSFISLILILLGYFLGDWFIQLLYSSKYSGLGLLITLAFVLQAINLINMPIDAGLNALKRTDLGFKSLLIAVVLSLVIGFPLTAIYGVIGALLGMIIASLGGLVYRSYKLKSILNGVN